MGFDSTPWMLALAAALFVGRLVVSGIGPAWSLPLQTAAMIVLGAIALIAFRADTTTGGFLVAAALIAHAGWDIRHWRTGRVVDHSLAEFCAVLDILVAVFVVIVTLAS